MPDLLALNSALDSALTLPVYVITPLLAWLVAGCLKFMVNSIRAGKLAFGLIGYGGLPSNHSAIVSSTAALIALREGLDSPAFGVALTLAFIVMLDASSLRRQIGRQATVINALMDHIRQSAGHAQQDANLPVQALRERMGHTPLEILAGIVVGVVVAYGVSYF